MSTVKLVTCNKCGWVHAAMTLEQAEHAVKEFNAYFERQNDETKAMFGGKPASVEKDYDHCFNCGQTERDFRPFKEGDCPDGCTIQPTIYEGDDDAPVPL